jgi:hypothetical protein
MRTPLLMLLGAAVLPGATFYVTVAGLGGEPEYEQRFAAQAQEIDKLVRAGNPDAKVQTLYGHQATKVQVQSVLAGIAKEAKPADAFVLMLIGHGSFDGIDYKINLPGPDLSAVELAALLDRIPANRQLVVNMTSSSGGSRAALEKPNRAIITATKSGSRRTPPSSRATGWKRCGIRRPTPTRTKQSRRSKHSSTRNRKPRNSTRRRSAWLPSIPCLKTQAKATA